MKLFVFYYCNGCDYQNTVLIQNETEKAARLAYWISEFDSYTEHALKSPPDPRNPYHVPLLTWPQYQAKYGNGLGEYKLTHVFDVLPNANPSII